MDETIFEEGNMISHDKIIHSKDPSLLLNNGFYIFFVQCLENFLKNKIYTLDRHDISPLTNSVISWLSCLQDEDVRLGDSFHGLLQEDPQFATLIEEMENLENGEKKFALLTAYFITAGQRSLAFQKAGKDSHNISTESRKQLNESVKRICDDFENFLHQFPNNGKRVDIEEISQKLREKLEALRYL